MSRWGWSRGADLTAPATTVRGVAAVSYETTDTTTDTTTDPTLDPQPAAARLQPADTPVASVADPIVTHRDESRAPLVLLVMLIILGCSGAGAIYWVDDDDPRPSARPAASASPSAQTASASPSPSAVEPSTASPEPSPSPSRPATRSPSPTPRQSRSPSPTPTGDITTARVGDCFVDHGTAQNPDLHQVACTSGTLIVLRRFDGTSDMGRCSRVPGTTNMYFYQINGAEATSFVLCMRQR
ncbi:MAG: hypothetical protein HKP61_09350 [Dactylosporangium sp.]|nr:hypothetical protein [Dactylosporangium sp.]NNJ61137.1 hypothetical protein [Dactylosporangium sp.]